LEQRILAEARVDLEPRAADFERVRAALAERLPPASVASQSALPNGNESASVGVEGSTMGAWKRFLFGAGLGLGVGFGAGYYAAESAQPAAPVVDRSVVDGEKAGDRTLVIGSRRTAIDDAAPEVADSHVPAATHARRAAAPLSTPTREAEQDSLDAELALVKRAESAVRAENPLLAFALLRELDEKHEQGVLHEERAAIRAMARCQQTTDVAARETVASEYASRFSKSVYTQRLQAQCGLPVKDVPGAGD
jgi:hypothetical protein